MDAAAQLGYVADIHSEPLQDRETDCPKDFQNAEEGSAHAITTKLDTPWNRLSATRPDQDTTIVYPVAFAIALHCQIIASAIRFALSRAY